MKSLKRRLSWTIVICIIAMLMLIALPATVSADSVPAVSFLPLPAYPVVSNEWFATGSVQPFTAGDFNRDGKLDLAVVNPNQNSISILLGKGDGTFIGKTDYLLGNAPQTAAIGDFNRDGKPDLAVSIYNHPDYTIAILLGIGDGTFDRKADCPANYSPGAIAVDDFNGDGRQDFAVGYPLLNTISIYIGNGDGTFNEKSSLPAGAFPDSVAVGDFNGDGYPDLAFANVYGHSISVFIGKGDGSFNEKVDYPSIGDNPKSVATDDFNGDGNIDLAVANHSNYISILAGNGDGTFTSKAGYWGGNTPFSAAPGDFNGDGKPDLAIANVGDTTVSIFTGKGDGTFNEKVDFPAGNHPAAVAAGDFNGDGRPDLAAVMEDEMNTVKTVTILLNNSGSPPAPTDTPSSDAIVPHLKTDKDKYIQGDIVPLALTFTNTQPGDKTNSVTFELEYDGSTFELAGDENTAIVNGYLPFTMKMNLGTGATGKLLVTYVDMDNNIALKEGMKIFTANFKVKNNPPLGVKTFTLRPVDMLDSSGKVYNVNNDTPVTQTVEIRNDGVAEGTVNLYLGDSGTGLNSTVLAGLNQAQINETFRNLKFTLKHNVQDAGTVLNGSDVFIPDENGNLAVKGEDGKVTGKFRVHTQDTANTKLTIDGAGCLAQTADISLNLGVAYRLNTPVDLYPGDVGRIDARQLVLAPDGKITNADFSAWLQIYKNNAAGTATPEDKLRADFTRDGIIDNVDFSLWLATYRKLLVMGQ